MPTRSGTKGHRAPRPRQTMAEFVHLHVHSQYSMLDGALRIERMVQRAK